MYSKYDKSFGMISFGEKCMIINETKNIGICFIFDKTAEGRWRNNAANSRGKNVIKNEVKKLINKHFLFFSNVFLDSKTVKIDQMTCATKKSGN